MELEPSDVWLAEARLAKYSPPTQDAHLKVKCLQSEGAKVLKSILLVSIICAPGVAFGHSAGRLLKPAKSAGKVRREGARTAMRVFALRLTPGQDLRQELETFTKTHRIGAGFILTAVGSLRRTQLRLADQEGATTFEGKYEIVSLVGTLSPDGPHLHLSLSDSSGKTVGGHLVAGCEIYTTAEIVIGDATEMAFTREVDQKTGYKELTIRRAKGAKAR